MEAIILAGGKGTRLQSVVADVPKPMANVVGKPFLCYLLDFLIEAGVTRLVLSVGYKAESIVSYFGQSYRQVPLVYAHESVPLGTGGGLRLALQYTQSDTVLVLNGDTFTSLNLQKLHYLHQHRAALFTMAVLEYNNSGRYGGVETDQEGRIMGFSPKEQTGVSYINTGIYMIDRLRFLCQTPSYPFSLEEVFFRENLHTKQIWAVPYQNQYFIDIGIPDDYYRAQSELLKPYIVQQNKFLFLDRDGVINQKIDQDYVRHWGQFEFKRGVLDALTILSKIFNKICVVTNQRGVSRKLMSLEDVHEIHRKMLQMVNKNDGRIDAFFICPHGYDDKCECRKPKSGLYDQAVMQYPEIKFEYSLMIGDSDSDIEAAYNKGMKAVLINSKSIDLTFNLISKIDFIFDDLFEFAIFKNK